MKLPALYRANCCGRVAELHELTLQPVTPDSWAHQSEYRCHPNHGCNAEGVTR